MAGTDRAGGRPHQDEVPAKEEERQADNQPAEEWGQRDDTGKTIARGGRDEGKVRGAQPEHS